MSEQFNSQKHDDVYNQVLAACNNNELVTLLENEPNICSIYNKHGETVFLTACKEDNINVATSLVKCHPACLHQLSQNNDTPLHMAAFGGAMSVTSWLLSEHSPSTHCNNDGYTPLHIASEYGHIDIVALFLHEARRRPDEASTTITPLHRAALFGCLEVAKLLVAFGYDVNSIDENGNTPLHNASRGGNLELVAWFLSVEADDLAANKENLTPADVAASQIIRDLFSHYANDGNAVKFAKQYLSEHGEEEADVQQKVHEAILDAEHAVFVGRAKAAVEDELLLLNKEKLARRIRKTALLNDTNAPLADNEKEGNEMSDTASDFSEDSHVSGASTATFIMPDDYQSDISDALTPLNLPDVGDALTSDLSELDKSPRSQFSENRSLRISDDAISVTAKHILRSHSSLSAETIAHPDDAMLCVTTGGLCAIYTNISADQIFGSSIHLLPVEIHNDELVPAVRNATVMLDYRELYEIAKRGSVLNTIYDVNDSETDTAREKHLMQRQVSAEVEFEQVYEPKAMPQETSPPTSAVSTPTPHAARGMSKGHSKRKLIVEKDPTQWRNLLTGFDKTSQSPQQERSPHWNSVLKNLDAPVRRNSADMRGSIEWRSLLKSIDKPELPEETQVEVQEEVSELDDMVPSETQRETSSENESNANTNVAVAPSDISDADTVPTISRTSSLSAVSEVASSRPSQLALTPKQLRHMNSLDVFRTELPDNAFSTISRSQMVNSPMYDDIRVEYLDAVAANLEAVFVRRDSTSSSDTSSHGSQNAVDVADIATSETVTDATSDHDIAADALVEGVNALNSVTPEVVISDPVDGGEEHEDYFAVKFDARSSCSDIDDSEDGEILPIAMRSERDTSIVTVPKEDDSMIALGEEERRIEGEEMAEMTKRDFDAKNAHESEPKITTVDIPPEIAIQLEDNEVKSNPSDESDECSVTKMETPLEEDYAKQNADDTFIVQEDNVADVFTPLPPVQQRVAQDNVWNSGIRRESISPPRLVPAPVVPVPATASVKSSQAPVTTPPVNSKQPRTPPVDRKKEKISTQLPTPPGYKQKPHYSTPTTSSTLRSRKAVDSDSHSHSTSRSRQEERNHSVPPKKAPMQNKKKESKRSKSEPPPARKKRVTGFSDNHFIPTYEKPSYKHVSSRLFKPTESYLSSCWRGDISKRGDTKEISPVKSASKRTPTRTTPPHKHRSITPTRHASPRTDHHSSLPKDSIDHSSNPEDTSPRRHSAGDYSNIKSRLYTPTEAFVNGRWVAQFEHHRKSYPSPDLKVHVSDRLLKPTTATLNGQWKGSPKSPNDDDAFQLPTLSNPRQFEHVESRLLHATVASTHWRWDHEHPSPEQQYHHGHWWDKVPTTAEMLHEEGADSPRHVEGIPMYAPASATGQSDDYFMMDVESTSNQSEQSTY